MARAKKNSASTEPELSEAKVQRATHLQDRSRERKKRAGPRLNEDTLAMQSRYEEQGYHNIAEILFLMANDAFDDLQSTAKEYTINSEQYNDAFARASKAVTSAAPYFCKTIRTNVEITNNIDTAGVEESILKLLNKDK